MNTNEPADFSSPRSLVPPKPRDGQKWGDWTYRADANALEHRGSRCDVALEEIKVAKDVLEWQWKLVATRGQSPQSIFDFVMAIDACIGMEALIFDSGLDVRKA